MPACSENCVYAYDEMRNSYFVKTPCPTGGCYCPVPSVFPPQPGDGAGDVPCKGDQLNAFHSFRIRLPLILNPVNPADWVSVACILDPAVANSTFRFHSGTSFAQLQFRPAAPSTLKIKNDPGATNAFFSIPNGVDASGNWTFFEYKLTANKAGPPNPRLFQVVLPGLLGSSTNVSFDVYSVLRVV